jgi:predicted Zn-dependent protease
MATKAKTEPAQKSTPVPPQAAANPLADAFGKALKLMDAAKYGEAAKALEGLMHEAEAAGDWAMKRRAQVYLTQAESKIHPSEAFQADTISEIQACINRREPAEALKLIEKALKTHAAKAVLYYLRAIAFAQSENTEASAESLKKAMELEPAFVYQWHMEPDFNTIRKSALFAFTEGR